MGALITWVGLWWQTAAGHKPGLGPLARTCVHLLAWGRAPAVLLSHAGPLAVAVCLATSSGLASVAWAIGPRGGASGRPHRHRVPPTTPHADPPAAERGKDGRK